MSDSIGVNFLAFICDECMDNSQPHAVHHPRF